ncbi:hypothetical protein [Sodalis ligni]|uniref:hypothetical protein n=1 Tax=Sodalis ligni TaxID=2697027 RepID=UPI002096946B|nr:hypothetical protein [Sodalis ligni]
MKSISITNRDLSYGIKQMMFLGQTRHFDKDHLRQSRDEELVADLVAYMLSETPVSSRTELFEDYYGATYPLRGANFERFEEMDQSIRRRNPDLVDLDYQRTHDTLMLLLHRPGQLFLILFIQMEMQAILFPVIFKLYF